MLASAACRSRRPTCGTGRGASPSAASVSAARRPAWTAGALAMLPPGGCQDAVEEDGELTSLLVEALHEVVNVLSALFNTPGAPHSKLHKLYAPGEEVPGDLAGMLSAFNRVDLAIEVPTYGKGALSLVVP